MSFIIRPANANDLQQLYEMAKLTGGGFTNLPADRQSLTKKIERSDKAFARTEDILDDDRYFLVLENISSGKVRGTCQIFAMVGREWPFYSYRISTLTQSSQELDRVFSAKMLSLVTDLEGASEVGGLFLHPEERAGGLGLLIARSRYLFIKAHRKRFADTLFAELRGVIDDAGGSPFWDGLAGRFFGMPFQEADEFNAIHGNQFIADLMPKHPIYVDMLSETARQVIGVPHQNGRAAMRMLENEGFRFDHYIDIFDGGPTMVTHTDRVKSIENAHHSKIIAIDDDFDETAIVKDKNNMNNVQKDNGGYKKILLSHGQLKDFRAGYAFAASNEQGDIRINRQAANTLKVDIGDKVWRIDR